ncbi:hypothetical protein IFM89_015124 [Coptis chinensis]|uniref:F-box protein n=1 Tax=Coptis chinensis TaxID=261450 RepID=A0A835IQ82_9MAGN|nr:hypothetical protein IFM89_015124 [Coptis chinensis]
MCLSTNDRSFYICNPITREILELRKTPFHLPKNYHYWRGQSGFAFDVTTRTFKVVYTLVCGYDGYLRTEVYMYTLGSRTWRWVDLVPAIILRFRPDSSQVLLHDSTLANR